MQTSYFLAQLFGATLGAIGLGILANPKYYYKLFKNLIKNEGLLFLSGFITLPIGLTLTMHHNVWDGPWWTIAITILSWAILSKGILLFVAPEWTEAIGKKALKHRKALPMIGFFYLLFGAIFTYYGFAY